MTLKANWRILAPAATVVIVCAIAGLNFYSASSVRGASLADTLKRGGYLEIRPAANFDGPGTIVTVDSETDEFVMLHPACNMNWKEVSDLWQVSPSLDTESARRLSGTFTLGAEFQAATGIELGAAGEVDVRLENTKVLVISDESRSDLQVQYLKGGCLAAVKAMVSRTKKCVTQPISALQADVSYRVKFSNTVTAEEKAATLDKLSAALSTDGRRESSDTTLSRGADCSWA
jgi:hypothetical protein